MNHVPAAIDVALPYYGDVDLMKQAVRSVLGQQFQHWRLFVVDDGFPDPEPARWFAQDIDDQRVTYQRNEHNLGANGNYRKCLDLATAPILVVMGADDVMQPNFLQLAVDNFAAFGDAAVVQCGVAVIDEHGRLVRPLGDRIKERYAPNVDAPTLLVGEDLAVSLLRANWTYFPSLAWRTEIGAPHRFPRGPARHAGPGADPGHRPRRRRAGASTPPWRSCTAGTPSPTRRSRPWTAGGSTRSGHCSPRRRRTSPGAAGTGPPGPRAGT